MKLLNALNNANTLVLGSFNPHNPNNDNVDYFYGRCSNYFWKCIAELEGQPLNYYFNDISRKVNAMENYKFCFLDIIEEIEIKSISENDNLVTDFSEGKIYKEFSDNVLFTTKTYYLDKKNKVRIERKYNLEIIKLLERGIVTKVIHTMGNITLDNEYRAKWKEKKLKENGFQGYIERMRNINTNIKFIETSYSPSAYAVRMGGEEYRKKLRNWIDENIGISAVLKIKNIF